MPGFLNAYVVAAIHDDQIRLFGGVPGVRDWSLLGRGVAQPAATCDGRVLYKDPHAMAAALGHGIITAHPFVDGNKRAGGMDMLAFLALNGLGVDIPEAAYYELVMAVASGSMPREELAESLRRWTKSSNGRAQPE